MNNSAINNVYIIIIEALLIVEWGIERRID